MIREVGELIHSDVKEMPTPGTKGERYFVTFIDDASRYTYGKALKNKSEVAAEFFTFHSWVKTQTGKNVKAFRDDAGGEYMSTAFKNYLATHGIEHQQTMTNRPQQNGVAERMMRTLSEGITANLSAAVLPNMFWPHALKYVIDTKNREVHRSTNKMPVEVLRNRSFDHEAWLKFAKPFGAKAVVQNDKWMNKKGGVMTFLGYSGLNTNAYTFVKLQDPKVTRDSTDVRWLSEDTTSVLRSFHDEDLKADTISNWREEEYAVAMIESWVYADATTVSDEPKTIADVNRSPNKVQWQKAMKEEMESLMKTNTFIEEKIPTDRKSISLKWVFKLKTDQDGKPQRFKPRLVARGFTQVAGLDYDETYSPVVRIETIRLMVSLAASMKMPIKQLDIPTAYLNGVLDKPIYTCIDGVDYRINKALYGLKQSGRLWNQRFHEFMVTNGFTRCTSDGCMYIHSQKMIILLLYVDDLLVLGKNPDQVETFEESMVEEFKAVQMGELSHILGISITKNAKGYQLSQSAYVDRILAKYGLTDCNPAAIPMNPTYTASPLPSQGQENYRGMIGSLLYLANCTRPDISAAVCKLAQRFNDYGDNELIAVKRIMQWFVWLR